MIFGMPASSFFAFAIWPVIWTITALIVYRKMAIDDAMESESEMEVNNE